MNRQLMKNFGYSVATFAVILLLTGIAHAYTDAEYDALVDQIETWRDEPQWAHAPAHARKWSQVLATLGESSPESAMPEFLIRERAAQWPDSRWATVAAYLDWRDAQAQAQQTPPESQTVDPDPIVTAQSQQVPAWKAQAPDQSLFDTARPSSFTRQGECTGYYNGACSGWRQEPILGDATYKGRIEGDVKAAYSATHFRPGIELSLNTNASRMDADVSLWDQTTKSRQTVKSWPAVNINKSTFASGISIDMLSLEGQFYNEGEAVYGRVDTSHVEGIFAATQDEIDFDVQSFVRWEDAAFSENFEGTMPNWLRSPDDPNDDLNIKGWGPWDDLPISSAAKTSIAGYDPTFRQRVPDSTKLDKNPPDTFIETRKQVPIYNEDQSYGPACTPGNTVPACITGHHIGPWTRDDDGPSAGGEPGNRLRYVLGGATYEGDIVGTIHPNIAHDGQTRPWGYFNPKIHFELDLDARGMDAFVSYAYFNPGDDQNGDPRRSRLDAWYDIDLADSDAKFAADGLMGQFYDEGSAIYGLVQRPKIIGRFKADKQ